MADPLDLLVNEIEQGFMQRGGWKACRYLLGKFHSGMEAENNELEQEIEQLKAKVESYRRAAIVLAVRYSSQFGETLGQEEAEAVVDEAAAKAERGK